MFTLQLCLLSICVWALLKFLKSYVEWYRSPLWALPGPPFLITSWFLGQFPDIMKEPYMEPHKRWFKQAGGRTGPDATTNVDWIHFCLIGGKHSVVVYNADYVRQILTANAGRRPRYLKKLNKVVTPILGSGLVNLEGENWQRHRHIINPSFQTRFVKDMLERAVPGLVNRFISHWRQAEGREIDVMEHFSSITLDVLGKVAFSHDFHALDSVQTWTETKEQRDGDGPLAPVTDQLMRALQEQFKFNSKKLILTTIGLSQLDGETQRMRKAMNDAVDDIIQKMRLKVEMSCGDDEANTPNGTITVGEGSPSARKSKYVPTSLLERLVDASGTYKANDANRTLSDAELRDEIKTFIVAGHETTATWCHWCIFALCKYPDVQQKLYENIVTHAPLSEQRENATGHENGAISLKAVEQMQYLDVFMKEVLRLYPPAGLILRDTTRDETFDGTLIPANTRISIPIHLLHRSPRYWSNPDEFRPERWLAEDGRVRCPASHKYAYLPFSTGPRNCIGHQFATVEAKLIMAPVVRAFKFQLAPSLRDTEFKFTSFMTMKAKPAVKVCLQSRSASE